ncbi:MAG TPA: DNA sulfur modification protein DndB [Allosphingosinicella sp.]|nr:DNA sulfur modification protein DndB [Allosphingosinicella sp.]
MSEPLYLPALQGSFGDWTYYVALMELNALVERVGYARQLQRNERLSQLIQRRLDEDRRAQEISQYLLATQDRFFNSLVVGVLGGAPEWHPFSLSPRRQDHDLGAVIERDQDLVGYFELSGQEALFALDGQHRLAGIKRALDQRPELGSEKLSVLFVPHQDTPEGLIRTRGLFISINKKAVPVNRRDIIVLDEVDLAAIITRQLLDEHPWFSGSQIDFERFTNSLSATSPHWTTIGNFYDLNATIINSIVEGRDQEELQLAERNRLPEDRIAFYRQGVVDFYDRLAALDPALRAVFEGADVPNIVREARSPPEPHLLFRPIGLKIVGRVAAELRGRRRTLNQTFRELRRMPVRLDRMPFSATIWDPDRGRMVTRGESLATRLVLYMLGLLPGDDRLRQSYADWLDQPLARTRLPRRFARG